MKFDKVKSAFESAFATPLKSFHRGSIVLPQQPLDLEELVLWTAESEDEQDDICNNGVETTLEENGWSCSTLVAFYWQSWGPMVWQAELRTLTHKKGLSFACWQGDGEPSHQLIVHCRCENDNRCAACGGLLAARKLNANYFDPADGSVWHVPGFSGFHHQCTSDSKGE